MLLYHAYLSDFYILFIFSLAGFFLALVLFGLTYLLNTGSALPEYEKLSAYECGFDPVEDNRYLDLDMKFYKVAVLFIIFDIEIVFLFPWSVIVSQMQLFTLLVSWFFLCILLSGLYLEYDSKSLDW